MVVRKGSEWEMRFGVERVLVRVRGWVHSWEIEKAELLVIQKAAGREAKREVSLGRGR